MLRFEEIQPEDIPAIFDVRVATWHNPNGREELNAMGITHESVRAILGKTHRGWLCRDRDAVIGFAMGDKTNGEMWVIAVLNEYEGRGVGRDLLTRVEHWLAEEGWEQAWLTTDTDEALRAVGFYRHLGWEDWKIEDGDRFMRKRLGR
ncbi:MAG: GNAT family N-acetyltransferase [Planctomycetota bacterium]